MSETIQIMIKVTLALAVLSLTILGAMAIQETRTDGRILAKILRSQKSQQRQILRNADLISDTQDKQNQSYDALQKQVTEQADKIARLEEGTK